MINSQGGYQSGPGVDVTCDIYFVGHCTDHVSRYQAGRVWKQVKLCSDSLFAGALDAIDGNAAYIGCISRQRVRLCSFLCVV